MLSHAVKWLLDRPADAPREKPEEVFYWLNERPPTGVLLTVAVQHTLLVLMLMVYAVLAANARGMGSAETISYLSGCFLVFGIGTMLQGLRTRITPGVPVINIPSPLPIITYVALIELYGLGAAMGAVVAANLILLLLVPYLPRLRAYFPPEVIGVVIFLLGLELVAGGITRSVGLTHGERFSGDAALVALATLGGILVTSVWGGMRLRIMAVLIGTIVGVGMALATGLFDAGPLHEMEAQPLFAVPLAANSIPLPEFVPMAILVYFVVELLGAMQQMASALTIDKLNNRKWHRADMPLVSRSVIAQCIQNLLAGATGMLSGGGSGAHVGLAHASGIMSRHVAIAAGVMMILLAFVPGIASVVVLTPEPVVGGILVYTAAFMIVAAMELVLSRMINMKRTFTVGLSIVVGSSLLVVPHLTDGAPEWSHAIIGSALMVGSLCAIGLNVLFRIGIKQTAETVLPATAADAAAADFLEHHGKIWGARRDVILRAGMAVGEVTEILKDAQALHGPVKLTTRFDEVDLVCMLSYDGVPPNLGPAQPVDLEALLEAEDDAALEAGMAQISSAMIQRLADRVRATTRKGHVSLVLHFEH